jgi:hypothetical protein
MGRLMVACESVAKATKGSNHSPATTASPQANNRIMDQRVETELINGMALGVIDTQGHVRVA